MKSDSWAFPSGASHEFAVRCGLWPQSLRLAGLAAVLPAWLKLVPPHGSLSTGLLSRLHNMQLVLEQWQRPYRSHTFLTLTISPSLLPCCICHSRVIPTLTHSRNRTDKGMTPGGKDYWGQIGGHHTSKPSVVVQ